MALQWSGGPAGGGPSGGGGGSGGNAEPTFTVNVTPSQALQGAKLAAQAGAAGAAAAPPAGGSAPANPFLANAHLSKEAK